MNKIFTIVKKYIDEYDYYCLLREGAPEDEFASEALRMSDCISEDSTVEQIAAIIADVFPRNGRIEVKAFHKMFTSKCVLQSFMVDWLNVPSDFNVTVCNPNDFD